MADQGAGDKARSAPKDVPKAPVLSLKTSENGPDGASPTPEGIFPPQNTPVSRGMLSPSSQKLQPSSWSLASGSSANAASGVDVQEVTAKLGKLSSSDAARAAVAARAGLGAGVVHTTSGGKASAGKSGGGSTNSGEGDNDAEEEEENDDDGDDDEEEVIDLEDKLAEFPEGQRLRLMALVKNHEERETLTEQYREERRKLDEKYAALYTPLEQSRAKIVTGETAVEGEPPAEAETEAEGETNPSMAGIPRFWVTAFAAHALLDDEMTERDREALSYCTDVTCADTEGMAGFTITFAFCENPFFTNAKLIKRYDIPNMGSGEEPMLENLSGTEIDWKDKEHNLVTKERKKKQRQKARRGQPAKTRTITVQEDQDSFFQFFYPPELPDEGTELTEDQEEMLTNRVDKDIEMGMAIREKVVPHAVLFFLGVAADSDSDYDPEEDEESEEEEDSEDDDDDDEADNESTPIGGGTSKGGAPGAGGKEQECKQQ